MTGPRSTDRPAEALQEAIAREQQQVDAVYGRLDELRATYRERLTDVRSTGAVGTHQNRSERDAFAAHYEDALGRLEAVENRLVFGRLDLHQGERPRYVGRIGLSEPHGRRQLLVDWRAPSAQPFYQATAAQPGEVIRRRHLMTRGREVVSLEDELLDGEAAADVGSLAGEGALFAAMAAAREGRMSDIVATIQSEQDTVIRSPLDGVLVVQGGPGTGKTAVALHRVAFLLYEHRSRLERSGVLLVGPSRAFLRYIEQVLPSLGETDVVTTTMAELLPGTTARGHDRPEVAELKGRATMARLAERAVRGLQRVPSETQKLDVEGVTIELRPEAVRRAISRARRTGYPHNQARETFALTMLEDLMRQYGRARGRERGGEDEEKTFDAEDRAWLQEDLRSTPAVRRAVNLCWMPTTAHDLLERLYARPDLLAHHARGLGLSARDRELLRRDKGAPWTESDIPILDELAELLGGHEGAESARAASQERRRREEEVQFAAEAIEAQDLGEGIVSAEMLAGRFAATGPRLTTAERAAEDRTWTYGHIVVDEAQELTDMAWRALLRRCPARSMTVVGDLAQRSAPGQPGSWGELLSGASGGVREAVLTISYRTPATVLDSAVAVVSAAGSPPPYPVTAARDLPGALAVTHSGGPSAEGLSQAVAGVVAHELSALDDELGADAGRLAVLCAHDRVAHLAAELRTQPRSAQAFTQGGTSLDARAAVLTAVEAKGLEFDVVVLVEPAEMLRRSAGDLYVAMTRPTRRLHVVHAGDPPAGLETDSTARPE